MKRCLMIGIVLLISLIAGCGGGSEQQPEGPLSLSSASDGLTGKLVVSPGTVGPNTFTVSIADESKKAVTAGQATLHFAMKGMDDHGKSELQLTKNPDGHWTGEGPHLMMGGEWQVQLVWLDEAGKSHSFDYTITLAE